MKKITALVLCSVMPAFIHTMEQSKEISPSLLEIIKNNMRAFSGTDIKMKSQSPDGSKVAILDIYGNISLWDGKTGKVFDKYVTGDQKQKDVLSLGFNDDGTKVIVTTSKGTQEYAAIANAANVLDIIRMDMRNFGGNDITMKSPSPDGTKIAILDERGNVSLWDGKTGKVFDKYVTGDQKQKDVLSLGFNEDGTKVLVTTSKGTQEYAAIANAANVLDIIKMDIRSFGGNEIRMKNQSSDGTKIVILDERGNVSLWDAKTGKVIDKYVIGDQKQKDVVSLGFNEDHTKVIVTTSKGTQEFSYKKLL